MKIIANYIHSGGYFITRIKYNTRSWHIEIYTIE